LRKGQAASRQGQHAVALESFDAAETVRKNANETWREHELLANTIREKWRKNDFPSYKSWVERHASHAKAVPIQIVSSGSDTAAESSSEILSQSAGIPDESKCNQTESMHLGVLEGVENQLSSNKRPIPIHVIDDSDDSDDE
jgi:hypothetical protein